MSSDRRRRGPRLIGPAVVALVRELARPGGEQTVKLRLSAAAADAIARAHACEHGRSATTPCIPRAPPSTRPSRSTGAPRWPGATRQARASDIPLGGTSTLRQLGRVARAGTIPVGDARRIGDQLRRPTGAA